MTEWWRVGDSVSTYKLGADKRKQNDPIVTTENGTDADLW